MRAVAYLSRTCGACAKFTALLAGSPKLLRIVEPRIIEADNGKNLLEMHALGAHMLPTLVVYPDNGKPMVYEGGQASQALINMA